MTSAQINAEIYNYGAALFRAVREAVLHQGTYDEDPARHDGNRAKLLARIDKVLGEAIASESAADPDGMWQAIWPRIVYAGTRSGKATAEVDSMREHLPMFQHRAHFDPIAFRFDEAEWAAWIALEGTSRNPGSHFRNTTPAVWKILTKDPQAYPGLRFSAMTPKIRKYLDVAALLHRLVGKSGVNALHLFTEGREFSGQHLTGDAWKAERASLARVQERLEERLGRLTALHTMMDLGLKTIKPDRVMTRLFSEAGWLRTLPPRTPADVFAQVYTRRAVVGEMTVRADVLAKALVDHGVLAELRLAPRQAHRLLDIWFVKYGQEPEPAFGITVNLQSRHSIRELLAQAKVAPITAGNGIGDAQAAQWWPCEQAFQPIRIRSRQKPGRAPRKARRSHCL